MRQIPVEAETPGAHGTPLDRAAAPTPPSAELLERALDGWERFLDGFEGGAR
ncbi:hypothetical protein IPZ70_11110 [Streptomyces polychromogenes]|nr:hypothetical protein [Streptomyces polychromogenes]